jgi:hypothetical protein
MSNIRGYAVSPETLLFLAWASQVPGLPQQLEQVLRVQGGNREQLLRSLLISTLPPAFERDAHYGPLYLRLFVYRLDQVEFALVDWALRGSSAVYLRPSAEDSASAEGQGIVGGLSGETTLLLEAIAGDERMHRRIERLGRMWDETTVRRGARLLRLYFTCHLPPLREDGECPFLVQEFIRMSLARVDWPAMAARVSGIPSTPLSPLLSEDEESEDPVVQLAAIKAAIWNGYGQFGEFGLQLQFSRALRDLCSSLADQCFQTHGAIGELEEAGEAFAQEETKQGFR